MAEVSTTSVQPSTFIESEAKLYLDQLKDAIGGLKDKDLSTVMGPDFVAGLSDLQKLAIEKAGGLGSYQPYLQTAGEEAVKAGQYVGPDAYKQFMSPYQQDVIGTTLSEYDIQAQKGAQGIPAAAIAAGAFGGGREGVQRAEYQSASDRNRAALQAQLLQQGFGQAQALAGQAFGQQQALSGQQMQLAGLAPQLAGQQIAGLTTLGGMEQAQNQAQLQAGQQLAYSSLYQPLNIAQQYGSGVMGLISGYPGQTVTQTAPSPSGLQTLLGAGSTLAGIYGALNPRPLYSGVKSA